MSASAGARLRSLMTQRCVALPGAFNGLVGRLVAEAGFDAAYVSGAAISAAAGQPDVGVLGLSDFCRAIREVALASGLPLIADADTGFGETEMIRKTVTEYAHAGAAGLHLEDQQFPKRCGHLDGKSLVSVEEMVEKITRAAACSRDVSQGEFIVCARTDARGVEGFDAAVSRAGRYVAAGADMIFPEGLATEEEFRLFAKAMKSMPGPAPDSGPFLLANMTEFGKTPPISVAAFAALGYHAVIFPVSTLRVSMKPVQEMLASLKETGTVESHVPQMYTRQELYRSLHYTPGVEWSYPSPSHIAAHQQGKTQPT